MLVGKILRISEPHARIISIDTSKAEKLPGVKAIVTFQDFIDIQGNQNNDILENCIANERILYDGHAVAAVAAVDLKVASEALDLIKIELPLEYKFDPVIFSNSFKFLLNSPTTPISKLLS